MKDGRDLRGRFARGNRGGPGRPRRVAEGAYLRLMHETVGMEQWRAIVLRALQQAEAGDAPARNWLARHLLVPAGRPDEPLRAAGASLERGPEAETPEGLRQFLQDVLVARSENAAGDRQTGASAGTDRKPAPARERGGCAG